MAPAGLIYISIDNVYFIRALINLFESLRSVIRVYLFAVQHVYICIEINTIHFTLTFCRMGPALTAFSVSVYQDQTAQNVQSDLGYTLSEILVSCMHSGKSNFPSFFFKFLCVFFFRS